MIKREIIPNIGLVPIEDAESGKKLLLIQVANFLLANYQKKRIKETIN